MQLVQQGKKKQEHVSHRGPYKAVREQRGHSSPTGARGAPGFLLWHSTAITGGQLQPSPGYPPTSREEQCKRGERNILPSAELNFFLIEFPE